MQPGFKTLSPRPRDHDWSADEAEWATDVMLTSSHSLSAVYPDLVKHAVTQFGAVVFFAFRHPFPPMAARGARPRPVVEHEREHGDDWGEDNAV